MLVNHLPWAMHHLHDRVLTKPLVVAYLLRQLACSVENCSLHLFGSAGLARTVVVRHYIVRRASGL
jgi:hypothetical protein